MHKAHEIRYFVRFVISIIMENEVKYTKKNILLALH